MFDNLVLAWAMPVDQNVLGARIESYGQTKASFTTFRCCIRHAGDSSLNKVPNEVVEMIEHEVREPLFYSRYEEWRNVHQCLTDRCRPTDHLTKRDAEFVYRINGMNAPRPENDPFFQNPRADLWDTHNDVLDKASNGVHRIMIRNHVDKLRGIDSAFRCFSSTFAFDFGLQPYFIVNDRDGGWHGSTNVKIKAYIVISIRNLIGNSTNSMYFRPPAFSMRFRVQPSDIQPLTAEKKRSFRACVQSLKLYPQPDPVDDLDCAETEKRAPSDISDDSEGESLKNYTEELSCDEGNNETEPHSEAEARNSAEWSYSSGDGQDDDPIWGQPAWDHYQTTLQAQNTTTDDGFSMLEAQSLRGWPKLMMIGSSGL